MAKETEYVCPICDFQSKHALGICPQCGSAIAENQWKIISPSSKDGSGLGVGNGAREVGQPDRDDIHDSEIQPGKSDELFERWKFLAAQWDWLKKAKENLRVSSEEFQNHQNYLYEDLHVFIRAYLLEVMKREGVSEELLLSFQRALQSVRFENMDVWLLYFDSQYTAAGFSRAKVFTRLDYVCSVLIEKCRKGFKQKNGFPATGQQNTRILKGGVLVTTILLLLALVVACSLLNAWSLRRAFNEWVLGSPTSVVSHTGIDKTLQMAEWQLTVAQNEMRTLQANPGLLAPSISTRISETAFPIMDQNDRSIPSPLPPTANPTISFTSTTAFTATITPTPLLVSSQYEANPEKISPALPLKANKLWVLNPETAIFDQQNTNWAETLEIDEEITFWNRSMIVIPGGAADVEWQMDVPLYAGWYFVYVYDTTYFSFNEINPVTYAFWAQSQSESLAVEITPSVGRNAVNFQREDLSGEDGLNNKWRLVGAYKLPHIATIKIQAHVPRMNDEEYYSISPLAIVRPGENEIEMLEAFPWNRGTILDIQDDPRAYTQEFNRQSGDGWNEQFSYILLSSLDTVDGRLFHWSLSELNDCSPFDEDQLAVWIPRTNADGLVIYELGNSNVMVNQKQHSGEWLVLDGLETRYWCDHDLIINYASGNGYVAADALAIFRPLP